MILKYPREKRSSNQHRLLEELMHLIRRIILKRLQQPHLHRNLLIDPPRLNQFPILLFQLIIRLQILIHRQLLLRLHLYHLLRLPLLRQILLLPLPPLPILHIILLPLFREILRKLPLPILIKRNQRELITIIILGLNLLYNSPHKLIHFHLSPWHNILATRTHPLFIRGVHVKPKEIDHVETL